jgi:hypothetical protein
MSTWRSASFTRESVRTGVAAVRSIPEHSLCASERSPVARIT